MRKPRPQEYGFENESEVRLAITHEDHRRAKISQIGNLAFLAGFLVSSLIVLLAIESATSVVLLTWPPAGKSHFVGQLFSVIVSAAAGLVLGLFCLFAARSLAERHWQPSTRYSKAKQYLDANWMWKQILQREYGYES